MMVVRVADGQISTVEIHLPSHLLWTVLLHLADGVLDNGPVVLLSPGALEHKV